jgi:hypothetical protein
MRWDLKRRLGICLANQYRVQSREMCVRLPSLQRAQQTFGARVEERCRAVMKARIGDTRSSGGRTAAALPHHFNQHPATQ